uniref:CUB domain-containing protein n=1 Tax=Timema shepardi TaxID=629360 RepID=A0A7R9FV36_TIMSH|nr:unnamed protein product [Timema shepardi]
MDSAVVSKRDVILDICSTLLAFPQLYHTKFWPMRTRILDFGESDFPMAFECEHKTKFCNEEINVAEEGFVMSPGYPIYYVNKDDCYWLLKASPGQRVQVTLLDMSLRSYKFIREVKSHDNDSVLKQQISPVADILAWRNCQVGSSESGNSRTANTESIMSSPIYCNSDSLDHVATEVGLVIVKDKLQMARQQRCWNGRGISTVVTKSIIWTYYRRNVGDNDVASPEVDFIPTPAANISNKSCTGPRESNCTDHLQVIEDGRVMMDECGELAKAIVIMSEGNMLNLTFTGLSQNMFPKRGVLFHYKAIGCVQLNPPKDGYMVFRNQTDAQFMCCVDYMFPDTLDRLRDLHCHNGNTWNNSLPDCITDKSLKPWGWIGTPMPTNSLKDTNITNSHTAAIVKESDFVFEEVVSLTRPAPIDSFRLVYNKPEMHSTTKSTFNCTRVQGSLLAMLGELPPPLLASEQETSKCLPQDI